MTAPEANTGTKPVADQHLFDVAALERYLDVNLPGFAGPLAVEQFKGGQSNPTYKLATPSRTYVMRTKPGPAAKLLPSAHAIDREFKVMRALHGTDVPVPEMLVLCVDEAVIGRAFYLMEFVAGRVLWDQSLPAFDRAGRAQIYDEMNRVIAALHSVDPGAVGLGDYGKPGNYFERQIGRWTKQYQASITEPIAAMDRLIEWLPGHIPASARDDSRVSIVHGDYRLDNLVFHPTEPRIVAVLDWELSTLGHPLADFSYHLMMYRMPNAVTTGLAGLDLAALNIPGEADYVAAYCRRTGRDGIAHLDFYMAFNLFRLAGIVHGIKGRVVRGTAASAHASSMAASLEPLAELAWAQALKAGAR